MISQKAKLHNRFDFEIYDIETGETEYAQAENIVLNGMWSQICAGNQFFNYIGVGTGSGTLSPARTTLFSHLAYKAAVAVETIYDTDTTAHVTKKITFSESEANGIWTEVGILFTTSTGSGYVTHALITDSEGNPITIAKTNTKIITVYATVFAEVLAPASGHYSTGGSRNAILQQLTNTKIYNMPLIWTSLLKQDGSPSLLGTAYTIWSNIIADAANKKMRTYLTRVGVADGNAPIRGIIVGTGPETQFGSVSLPCDVFPHKEYTGVAIGTGDGVTKQFDLPVSFVKSGSETVYVGGVAKTRSVDYTVRYGMRSADTLLVNVPDVSKKIMSGGGSTLEEIVLLPQPAGEEATITAVEMKNGSSSTNRIASYDIKLSIDGATWVDAGANASWGYGNTVTLNGFAPAQYKYLKAILVSGSGEGQLAYIKIHATPPSTKHITFAAAPTAGAAITADFSTEYINKTSNFVLDVRAEVVFGEGA